MNKVELFFVFNSFHFNTSTFKKKANHNWLPLTTTIEVKNIRDEQAVNKSNSITRLFLIIININIISRVFNNRERGMKKRREEAVFFQKIIIIQFSLFPIIYLSQLVFFLLLQILLYPNNQEININLCVLLFNIHSTLVVFDSSLLSLFVHTLSINILDSLKDEEIVHNDGNDTWVVIILVLVQDDYDDHIFRAFFPLCIAALTIKNII